MYFALTVFFIVMLQFSGCASKEATKQKPLYASDTDAKYTEEKTERETIPPIGRDVIDSYQNQVITWGPGVQTGENNRPIACMAFQEQYGKLYADFIREDEKKIYLTFDEGYENGYTEKILDVLKEHEVSAVFFVTMPYAEQEKDLIKRMVAEGHVIGNHSVSHPAQGMPSLSIEEQLAEYEKLHTYIKENFNYEMYLFRPPAGIFSEQSLAVAAEFGYRTVLWSFAYADWDPAKQPSHAEGLKKMESRLHNGAIYLLHAVSETNASVLGEFIDYAKEQGYVFAKYE